MFMTTFLLCDFLGEVLVRLCHCLSLGSLALAFFFFLIMQIISDNSTWCLK